MDEDDELANSLAAASEARSIEERLISLEETNSKQAALIADFAKRLAAKERQPKLVVWHWLDATDEERDTWVAEVKAWYARLEETEPRLAHRLLPCWMFHRELYWPVCQLYQQWQKSWTHEHRSLEDGDPEMLDVTDADLGGWWFMKWLSSYNTFLTMLKTTCHSECLERTQKLARQRLDLPDDLVQDMTSIDPDDVVLDPVPSTAPERGNSWGSNGWSPKTGPGMSL